MKKAQHPTGFEPTTSLLPGICSCTASAAQIPGICSTAVPTVDLAVSPSYNYAPDCLAQNFTSKNFLRLTENHFCPFEMNFATGVIFTLRLEIIKLRSSGRCIIFFWSSIAQHFFPLWWIGSKRQKRARLQKPICHSDADLKSIGDFLVEMEWAWARSWMLSLKLEGPGSGFKGQPQASRASLRLQGPASGLKAHARAQAWRFRVGLRLLGSGFVYY